MSVNTRRERRERELRRRQREKRGGQAPRGTSGGNRNLFIGLGVVVLLVLVVFGLRQAGVLSVAPVVATTPPPTPVVVASDDPARGVKEDDFGNTHVNSGTPVTYTGALPPSSGSHWPQPAGPVKAGIYDAKVPFEATTHNLEHGGIVIAYNGLSTTELAQLKQFVTDTMRGRFPKIVLEPVPELKDAKVTAVAWRWRLNQPTVDTSALLKFITVHYDSADAPEPGASF